MTISNQELKHLIGQVEAAAAAYQHTAGRIERVAAGGTPPVLFSTDSTTAYAFAPLRRDLRVRAFPGSHRQRHDAQ